MLNPDHITAIMSAFGPLVSLVEGELWYESADGPVNITWLATSDWTDEHDVDPEESAQFVADYFGAPADWQGIKLAS